VNVLWPIDEYYEEGSARRLSAISAWGQVVLPIPVVMQARRADMGTRVNKTN